MNKETNATGGAIPEQLNREQIAEDRIAGLKTGFNLISESNGIKQIAYFDDDATFTSILRGYHLLLEIGLSELITSNIFREDADKVAMLNLFMSNLSDVLLEGGSHE